MSLFSLQVAFVCASRWREATFHCLHSTGCISSWN